MPVIRFFETTVHIRTTWCYNPEDSNIQEAASSVEDTHNNGLRINQLAVKALCYKTEGRGFETR
jgi:hypothetical protein